MAGRTERLRKLVKVQQQLLSLHETRHATHLALAAAAEAEAAEVAARFDEPDSLSSLFPDVYHRHIAAAHARSAEQSQLAQREAARVAAARARAERIEETWKTERQWDERRLADRDRLDLISAGVRRQR